MTYMKGSPSSSLTEATEATLGLMALSRDFLSRITTQNPSELGG